MNIFKIIFGQWLFLYKDIYHFRTSMRINKPQNQNITLSIQGYMKNNFSIRHLTKSSFNKAINYSKKSQ